MVLCTSEKQAIFMKCLDVFICLSLFPFDDFDLGTCGLVRVFFVL